jgi:hypothetical protein
MAEQPAAAQYHENRAMWNRVRSTPLILPKAISPIRQIIPDRSLDVQSRDMSVEYSRETTGLSNI